MQPLVGGADLERVIVACYADYLKVRHRSRRAGFHQSARAAGLATRGCGRAGAEALARGPASRGP